MSIRFRNKKKNKDMSKEEKECRKAEKQETTKKQEAEETQAKAEEKTADKATEAKEETPEEKIEALQKELEKHIEIPKRASDNLKIIEYLTNRGIDESILNYCIINNLIYQEKTTNNVVFLGYDEENNIKYAGLRASNNTRIMHDAKGSSKEYSFRILAKEKVNSIHLFESAIDLLSYATLLKEKGTDWRKINLISLSGVYQTKVNIEESKIPIAIEKFLNKEPQIEEIILHFDNDMAGRNARKAFQAPLTPLPTLPKLEVSPEGLDLDTLVVAC